MSLQFADIVDKAWTSSDLRKPIDWLRFEQDLRDILRRLSDEGRHGVSTDICNYILALGAIDQVLAAHTRRGGELVL